MILLSGSPYTVARYHREQFPEDAAELMFQGPVVRVGVRFEHWLGGAVLEADAILDTGADCTSISLRWIAAVSGPPWEPFPAHGPDGYVEEAVSIRIGGVDLRLPSGLEAPELTPQGPCPPSLQHTALWSLPEREGREDILLGRDFLRINRLMLVVDGQTGAISLLYPIDADNRRRREQVLTALAPCQVLP